MAGQALTEHWDALLAPISAEQPCGASLRYSGEYDVIKEARREDADLPQGEWKIELKKADWREVETLCVQALTQRSKDLQIAVWLLEALLQRHGFAGVATGMQLIRSYCEQYWDSLWPEIDGDDIDLRISPIHWINEKLTVSLGHVVEITQPTVDTVEAYNFIDLQQSLQVKEGEAGKVSYATFLKSVGHTPVEFFVDLYETLRCCIDETDKLNALFDELCQRNAPSLSRFRARLDDIYMALHNILREKPGGEAALRMQQEQHAQEVVSEEGEMMAIEESAGSSVSTSNILRSREDAYRRLDEIADYLMKTEPHSPTPYLVKRAVSWGRLDLNDLLRELVNDEHDLRAIYALLGMQKKS